MCLKKFWISYRTAIFRNLLIFICLVFKWNFYNISSEQHWCLIENWAFFSPHIFRKRSVILVHCVCVVGERIWSLGSVKINSTLNISACQNAMFWIPFSIFNKRTSHREQRQTLPLRIGILFRKLFLNLLWEKNDLVI